MQQKLKIGLVIGCFLLIGIGLFWLFTANNEPTPALYPQQDLPTAVIREPISMPATPANPANTSSELNTEPVAEPLPAIIEAPAVLENSDASVLLAAADFSSTIGQWLLPDEQIRKWVLVVDLVADGKLPRRYRPVDYPMSVFLTEQNEQGMVAADLNFSRTSLLINTLASIDTQLLARYYQEWLPLLEKAYREQGKPGTFDQRLQQAISQVLAANPLDQKAVITRPTVMYRYTDEALEQASDIEKLLWRMGEDNSENLQFFLRDLRYQLDK